MKAMISFLFVLAMAIPQVQCGTVVLLTNPVNGSRFAYRGRKRPPLNFTFHVEDYQVSLWEYLKDHLRCLEVPCSAGGGR